MEVEGQKLLSPSMVISNRMAIIWALIWPTNNSNED